jgi:peptidoglycan L-alanyl-D-glutamate endopeptidase CwlK
MSLGAEQEAFTADLVKLISKAQADGYGVRMGEVQRTPEQQQVYMRAGRSRTMNSMHLKKCAADLFFVKGGKIATRDEMRPYGDFWESLNTRNRWGGSWRGNIDAGKSSFVDVPHFERQV